MTASISIHALREEGDADFILLLASGLMISIHALREEGDLVTPVHTAVAWNFYPRPPRGGRRTGMQHCSFSGSISIHALREEGDSVVVADRR